MSRREESSADAQLDDVDIAIIEQLERNGRMPNSQLARIVGIAESTCHQRVKALVASKVITGFHASIDRKALGLKLEALIAVRLHAHARSGLREFQSYLESLSATRQVYFVAGDRDFLVHVAVREPGELRELVSENISIRKEVAATNTSLIFDHAPRRYGGH